MESVWWVRRDMRLADNDAAAAAEADGGMRAVFCNDPAFKKDSARTRAMREALTELGGEVGGIHEISGRPEESIAEFAAGCGAVRVHVTGDHGPYGRVRDAAVAASLRARGIDLVVHGSNYVAAPGRIMNGAGTQMRTFRGFKTAWMTLARQEAASRSAGAPPRETRPIQRLRTWLPSMGSYPTGRDVPSRGATTGLSADVRFGTIHPGRILAEAGAGPGSERLAEQLCWREWYADNLWHDPEAAWRAADLAAPAVAVDTDAGARVRFAAWAAGQTGYAIVDAGMRELAATGWMHNRVRMITASFLVKQLHLPWQWGAGHFLHHLRDGDLASNNMSWQWVAGCGIDAAPFFRILNPSVQGERFDQDGTYVRRWVRELEDIPERHLHLPGCDGGYVAPIVDHAAERAEALARWKAARDR